MAAVGTLPRNLARGMGPKHQVHYNTYKQTVPCDFCHKPLAGFFRQGLKCKGCSKNFHKDCLTNEGNICKPASDDGLVMPQPPAPLKPTTPAASTQAPQPTNLPPAQQPQPQPKPAAAPPPASEPTPIASSSFDAPLYANISEVVGVLNPPPQVVTVAPPTAAHVVAVPPPAPAPRPTPADRPRGPSVSSLPPQQSVAPVPQPRPRPEPTPAPEVSGTLAQVQPAPAGPDNIKQFLHNYIKGRATLTPVPPQISSIMQPQVPTVPPAQVQAPPVPASNGFAPERPSMRRQPQPPAAIGPLEAARLRLNLSDTVLERAHFFHPLAPTLSQQERREYAAKKLKDQEDGSWLLRSSHGDYILVVKYGALVKNVRIAKTPALKYWIVEQEEFDSVIELLAHYTTAFLANDVPIPLRNPVPYNP